VPLGPTIGRKGDENHIGERTKKRLSPTRGREKEKGKTREKAARCH